MKQLRHHSKKLLPQAGSRTYNQMKTITYGFAIWTISTYAIHAKPNRYAFFEGIMIALQSFLAGLLLVYIYMQTDHVYANSLNEHSWYIASLCSLFIACTLSITLALL